MAPDLKVEHPVSRWIDFVKETDTQHFQLGYRALSQFHRLVFREGSQDEVQMARKNSARARVLAKNFVGQIALASEQSLSLAQGLIERMDFKAMEGVVMNKRPHGPVIRDDLAREPDQRSQLHALGFAVRPLSYWRHDVVISMLVR